MTFRSERARRAHALAREARRLQREAQLSILFAATSVLRAHLILRAARARLDPVAIGLLAMVAKTP